MSRLDLRLGLSLLLLAPACGDDGGAAAAGDSAGQDGGSLGAGQGGAQDFGQFKQILEQGGIPGPETLDDVGFFNEHKIELPPATCAGDVCLHGLYGEMGNMISGTNCITVLVGLNTAIDVSKLERPPLNLALVIDSSGSMEGEPMQYVREGLLRMLDALDPSDRITLVDFDTDAEVKAEYVTGSDPALALAISNLEADGGTNIYDGLRTGFELMAAHADPGRQNRVVFLSDGMATEGITNDAKILAMAQGYSEQGYGLTTIGVGADFDVTLMRTLSEQGSGAFYFLEDPAAVQEVFVEEVTAFLVPLAEDVTITADIVDNYLLRAIRGTKLSTVEGNHGAIEIPNLQLAHRETVDDHEDGRRGGGGAILLELLPRSGQPRVADVGELKLRYRHPVDKQYVEEVAPIKTTVDPGEIDLEQGVFDNPSSEKGFVMLNIYVGFDMAATRAAQGDLAGALNILDGLDAAVDGWLADNPDFDIEDDLKYIRMFIDNLVAAGAGLDPDMPMPTPPEPWPED
ncbi:Ca-activated chloride channel family protein [Nannocystis exedens]|uniref:Ca-activated chloride channel family protein n=1 Tax=Nannocystis exedens TaxID=54 RepID=A0A1I1XVR9_9BACT|nr:VWA domain-containing protein [Nannocystis exedens]PCC73243.1 von Willebrand factor type A domain protein [Nannocystis exedens]SFE09983.1 Ca-activated chloride channel family protein [Nannocystis exedens]